MTLKLCPSYQNATPMHSQYDLNHSLLSSSRFASSHPHH